MMATWLRKRARPGAALAVPIVATRFSRPNNGGVTRKSRWPESPTGFRGPWRAAV